MAQTVETLLRGNIHGVFSEPDAEKRHKAIARLWADDGVFVDHNDRIFVVDSYNRRIQVFRYFGLPKTAQGGPQ